MTKNKLKAHNDGMQPIREYIGAILFFFICLFLYLKIAGPIPFSVTSITTTKPDLFRVTGTGKASGTPDTAMASFGVTKTASSVQDGQNQVNTIANKISSDLKGLGIDEKDIQTTNYTVTPHYEFTNGKQTTDGYTVSENIEVKINPIEKANQAIDIATAAGANQIGGIIFVLNDKTRQELQKKATQQAITDAKQKAQLLADTAGIKLGNIADIQTQENTPYVMKQSPLLSTTNEDIQSPTELNVGENTITVSVTLGYQTL